MIIAAGGEFLSCSWTEDGGFVALDMHGDERVRLTWTGWPGRTRIQRLELVWDLCAVLIFPRFFARNECRRLDDASRIVPMEPAVDGGL